MKQIPKLLSVVLLLLIAACSGVGPLGKKSARQSHVAAFRTDPRLKLWNSEYLQARSGGVTVALPYAEAGKFGVEPSALAYDIQLKQGELVTLSIEAQGAVFSEISLGGDVLAESDSTGHLFLTAPKSGAFKLVVQPGLETVGKFLLKVERDASLGFPVAGKGNASIQSFWADVRDGGQRRHEGIDIFAKRGTPVVAVADGFVSFTGDRGLGGKQVWQRLGLFGHSVYYAHLDKIAVESGRRVRAGDTLGFVGNSGNASGTAPHLHFGIYTSSGAVDPLPFVYRHHKIANSRIPQAPEALRIKVATSAANLRISPDGSAAVVTKAPRNALYNVMGRSLVWLHVRAADGARGCIHRSVTTAVN